MSAGVRDILRWTLHWLDQKSVPARHTLSAGVTIRSTTAGVSIRPTSATTAIRAVTVSTAITE